MNLVLVGQPYSGKSTIFNEVVGYKSLSTNAPGSTAEHTHGKIQLDGETVEVVDLPGIYSLQVSDDAGNPTVDHVLNAPADTVLVNVIDTSVLSRSLELTLQLMELGRPMVVALNMADEAQRKGIQIDTAGLSRIIGAPVIETVGIKGEGVSELFREACRAGRERIRPQVVPAPPPVECFIQELVRHLGQWNVPELFNHRYIAIKLIERDPILQKAIEPHLNPYGHKTIATLLQDLEAATGQRAEFLMSAVRHHLAFELFETVARVGIPQRRDIRRQLDAVLTHPVLGYVFLLVILAATFSLIFKVGSLVEPVFLDYFEQITGWLGDKLGGHALLHAVVVGLVSGIGGGIGIVIPYLLPFFVALAFLEDTGYLPRIAYLVDNLMHRIGLHGMSVVPIIMGYGCSVPGVLATRILKSRRDKLITATLTTLIPCSARMTIIFGLIGFFISMKAAILVYVFNLLLIGLVGLILSKIMPEESPGMIMEIPRYHLPEIKPLARKTWFRLKEFVVIAWPILIGGSVVLEVINHLGLTDPINSFLAPYTVGLLGFPAAVGITLIFGIMRKEMALVLLFAALGTSDVTSVMSLTQIFGYTFFVTFYVPCLATFAALAKELSWRSAIAITLITLAIVSVLTVLIRLLVPLFG